MQALTFWKAVTEDHSNLLDQLITLLEEQQIRYCVIGGQAVNAYAEPVVSLDLDLVIASDQIEKLEALLQEPFEVKRFPHSLNISLRGSSLRVRVQTDPRYFSFVERAAPQEILGLVLPVARVEDVLQGKIWAFQDPARRASKRQKDLADIARLLEERPDLRAMLPDEIATQLLQ